MIIAEFRWFQFIELSKSHVASTLYLLYENHLPLGVTFLFLYFFLACFLFSEHLLREFL